MKKEKLLLFILLASITAVVLIPFINSGIAEGDDAELFLRGLSGNISSDAIIYAKDAGRFYFLITKPLYGLPYLLNSLILIKTINIFFLILILILVSMIVKQLFKSQWLAYLCYLLLLTFIAFKGENNPVISFQWYFTGSFIFILSSILFALKHNETGKPSYRIYSIVFYSIGLLFYEVYLLYLPILILANLSFISDWNDNFLKDTLWDISKRSLPYVYVGLVYIVLYFSYRIFYPGTYSGTAIAKGFKIGDGFDTVLNLSSGAYPGYFFFHGKYIFQQTSPLIKNHIQNIGYVFETANYLWYVKAIVTGILSYLFLSAIEIKNIKRSLIVLVLAVLYVFIPHIPLALTDKYTYQYPGMDSYITTFFAFLAVIFVITIVFSMVSYINNLVIKKTVIIIIVIVISIGSMLTDYINNHTAKWYQHSVNTLTCMNMLIETNAFKSIPDNSFIYSPKLYSNSMGYGFAYSRFKWGDYVYLKTKKKIKFASLKDELLDAVNKNDQSIFYLKYDYNTKDIDRLITIGPIAKSSIIDSVNTIIYTDSMTCFYYSSFKEFSLSFSYGDDSKKPYIYSVLNKTFTSPGNYAFIKLAYHDYRDYFKPIQIKGINIDMNSLNISNLSNTNPIDVIIR